MKKSSFKATVKLILVLAGMAVLQSSCKKDQGTSTGLPIITGVRAYKTSPGDSVLTKVNPGDYVVLQGSNFTGVKAVYFDGAKATINTALSSDKNVPIAIPFTIPFANITDAQFNTIVMITNTGKVTYKFPITAPTPYISSISNEMPNAGDVITLNGNGLFAIKSIVFPGNIPATVFLADSTGAFTSVQVPAGVTTMGPVIVTTKFGTSTAAINAVLNDTNDVFLNFDDKNGFTPWGPLPKLDSSVVSPSIQGNRGKFLYWYAKGVTPGTYWVGDLATPTDGSKLTYPVTIQKTEPASNLAMKLEVNIPLGMTSGTITFEFNYGHGYAYSPWLINGSTRVTVITKGWQTLMLPLSMFPGVSTYGDIIGQPMEIFYVNGGGGVTQDVIMGFDNFRIVKVK